MHIGGDTSGNDTIIIKMVLTILMTTKIIILQKDIWNMVALYFWLFLTRITKKRKRYEFLYWSIL